MLVVNADVISRLIDLSNIYHGQEGLAIPVQDQEDSMMADAAESPSLADSPAEDPDRQMLAGRGSDVSADEFKAIIDAMEPDQQQEVVALLWLGRGDYTLEEWSNAIQLAREQWTPDTGDYLLGHPLLAVYLQDGLEMHGYSYVGDREH